MKKDKTARVILLVASGLILLVAQGMYTRGPSTSVLAQNVCTFPIEVVEYFDAGPQPAMAGEAITLAAGGEWRNGCAPEFENLEIDGAGAALFLIGGAPPGYGCSGAVTSWSIEVEAGDFAAGTYTAELYITDRDNADGPVLCAVTPFDIVEPAYKFYLPQIRN